jgi:cystathionine beta-lyase/cystathionine gamma-synthase
MSEGLTEAILPSQLSMKKYLNGHSDVVGGAIVAAEKTDAEKLTAWANITGAPGRHSIPT